MLEHAISRDHSFSFMDAMVLKKEKHNKLRKFNEAIHILKTAYAINASKRKTAGLKLASDNPILFADLISCLFELATSIMCLSLAPVCLAVEK